MKPHPPTPLSINGEGEKLQRGRLLSISEILPGALPNRLALHLKIGEIKARWREVVDDALAGRTEPVMFEYGGENMPPTLVISARSPASAQKIKMLGRAIAARMKEIFDIEISNVRV